MNKLVLNNVTLFGIDCVDIDRLIAAAEVSQKFIQFGAIRLLSSLETADGSVVKIDAITNLAEYSRFMIKEAYKYIDTEYALVIQYDGFVLNPFAWSPDFLEYDYIGAPWWYGDDYNVGNGGFSLRSRRLMEAVALIPITELHPEDHVICRVWGEYLKQQGFTFAPEDVARRFGRDGGKWTKEFGAHASDISDWEIERFVDKERHSRYIEQFRELCQRIWGKRRTLSNSTLGALEDRLLGFCGPQYVFTDSRTLEEYGKDETLDLRFPFDILVKPANALEVSGVMRICGEFDVPLTPRGGGSGVTGGALPVRGGVVISLERLNKILEVNEVEHYVVAESGVVTADLCSYVAQRGLFFPIQPGSAGRSQIGGNIAENAGSINSCRYGTTGDYILNLEVVLPNGQIVWTGANVRKNATGLNLTSLFAGSEGILGIITKVVYRLLPDPGDKRLLVGAFRDIKHACEAVIAIKRGNLRPVAVELLTYPALRSAADYLQESFPLDNKEDSAFLLVEFQENTELLLGSQIESARPLLQQYTSGDILVADNAAERENWWKFRSAIGNALKAGNNNYRDIDVTVPLGLLYPFMTEVKRICDANGVEVIIFGHALDGNLHTMLLTDKELSASDAPGYKTCVREIYEFVTSHGGVLSGEHGIGCLQKDFIGLQFPATCLDLMGKVKTLFDPQGILNPGKVF